MNKIKFGGFTLSVTFSLGIGFFKKSRLINRSSAGRYRPGINPPGFQRATVGPFNGLVPNLRSVLGLDLAPLVNLPDE